MPLEEPLAIKFHMQQQPKTAKNKSRLSYSNHMIAHYPILPLHHSQIQKVKPPKTDVTSCSTSIIKAPKSLSNRTLSVTLLMTWRYLPLQSMPQCGKIMGPAGTHLKIRSTRQIRTPVLRIPPAVTSQAKMKNWLHECQKWVSHMIGQYAHI